MGFGLRISSHYNVKSVPTQHGKCIKINAQLCNVIKSSIRTSLKSILRPHESCTAVRSEVRALYANDIQYLYGMARIKTSTLLTPHRFEGPMCAYLGRLHIPYMIFNELLVYHL